MVVEWSVKGLSPCADRCRHVRPGRRRCRGISGLHHFVAVEPPSSHSSIALRALYDSDCEKSVVKMVREDLITSAVSISLITAATSAS